MAKRLSKTLWYGTDVDATGQPLLPPATTNPGDLDGLHKGELFMHLAEDEVTLWGVSSNGKVVKITGKSDEANIDLSDYLKKEVWDSVWEIRQDTSGQKYIYGKLPVVTQYGITMYADNGSLDIPSIYAGLPIDNITLVRDTNGVLMINPNLDLGSGGGASSWDELEGIPSWIGATKPTYEYSEIQNTPDLSKYVSSDDLSKYVTLGTEQTITGKKDFTTGGLFVNGKQIQYDATNGCWKLEGDLLVTGGVTMYADGTTSGGSSAYSTLGSLLNVDDSIDASASVDRVLFQAAGSSEWVTKPLSEIGGSVSGDYLPLSGGTLTGQLTIGLASAVPLVLQNTSATNSYIDFKANGWSTTKTGGVGIIREPYLGNEVTLLACGDPRILVSEKGGMFYQEGYNTETFPILHSGNYSSYALPLSGGTMTGGVVIAPSASYTTAITNNCTVLKLGSDTSGMNGYNSGLGFNALQRYSSTYLQHLHAWIGLSPCIDSAGSELYDLVFATNGSTTANTSPIERMRITHDGSVKIQRLFFGNTNEINSTDGSFLCLNYEGTGGILMGNNAQGVVVASNWNGLSSVIQQRLRQCMFSVRGGIFSYMEDVISKAAAFVFDKPGMHFTGIGSNGEADTIYFGAVDTTNLYSWISYSQIWKFGGSIITTGGITMYSDQRKKTILNHVELSLKQIADAPLIEHYYNSDQDKTTHVGSIAQYWAKLNDWFCKLDAEGFYTMEIQNCALASAISIARHLERYESKTDKKIRQLKKRISQLEDKIELLKKGA